MVSDLKLALHCSFANIRLIGFQDWLKLRFLKMKSVLVLTGQSQFQQMARARQSLLLNGPSNLCTRPQLGLEKQSQCVLFPNGILRVGACPGEHLLPTYCSRVAMLASSPLASHEYLFPCLPCFLPQLPQCSTALAQMGTGLVHSHGLSS